MKRIFSISAMLALLLSGCRPIPSGGSGDVGDDIGTHCLKEPVTVGTLLDEMTDCLEDTYFPSPSYTAAQVSSTDPRSVSVDSQYWFANDDNTGFVRMEGETVKVIFDAEGPGAVTRIWMAGKITDRTFKFYFDGESTPRIILDGNDLTSLSWHPENPLAFCHSHYDLKGGTTLYYPLPYSKSLKITVNVPEDYGVAYHIAFRKYAAGTDVVSFRPADALALKDRAREICRLLECPESYSGGTLCQTLEPLPPGGKLSMSFNDGTNVIRSLRVKVAGLDGDSYQRVMRSLLVTMTFDGNETVWCPLGDMSGGGYGAGKVDNWYMSADGKGSCEWRFPMPYRDSARIEIRNLTTSADPVVTVAANVDDHYGWCKNSAYFHVAFRQTRGLMTNNDYLSDNNREWTSAVLRGRGILKGDVLSVYNDTDTWYGEGDDKIYVDGEHFPSFFGTGLEDYYNTSFAPVREFQNAFGGAVRADSDNGSGYGVWLRTRNLDAVPFSGSLKFDWELLGWKPSTLIMSSVIYWYGDESAEAGLASDISELKYILP